ncbi:hypothetical protein D3C87_1465560 [compost metagenome]
MHVDQSVELRLGRLGDQGYIAMAGVVDDVINRVAVPGVAQRDLQALDECGKGGRVADIQLQGDRLAAHLFDVGHNGLGVRLAALVGKDNIAAFAGDIQGGATAQATAAAGDEGNACHAQAPR